MTKLILSRRLLWAAVVVAAGALSTARSAPRAHAMQACFTDPIVDLSNGQQVDLSATIDDTSGDVTAVAYSLVLPAGVTPTRVVYTGGAFAFKESLAYRNARDSAPKYASETLVKTATQGIAVTAQTRVTGPLGVASASVSGTSGQSLVVTVEE